MVFDWQMTIELNSVITNKNTKCCDVWPQRMAHVGLAGTGGTAGAANVLDMVMSVATTDAIGTRTLLL